jgi:hypothetical protein
MAEYSIILDKLKELGLFDAEYRTNEGSVFNAPYICGYLTSQDISVRIAFYEDTTNFFIEYLGHTQLNKSVPIQKTELAFECFVYLLKDMIDFSERFKEGVRVFPDFTIENNRDNQLKKLFEKNSYIPLVP